MRLHPIGTGPFKFVEFKANEYIKVAKNPNYWKQGRPFLDGIEYTIITSRSTAVLAFLAGKGDMSFPYDWTIPIAKDVKNQAPNAHLRYWADQRQHQPDRQSRIAAVRQSGRAQGHGSGA